LQDKIFVAHHVNFDYSFVKHQLMQCGYALQVKKLCTVRLSRKFIPDMRSYSLGNLCRSLNINIENRHRAAGDARATVQLFELLIARGAIEKVTEMVKRNSSEQWMPALLNKAQFSNLPDLPGVYYFHDAKGKVLYVGKAVNIRKRVTSHFTHHSIDRRRQVFLRNIADIRFTVCANELHALVLESAEIKRLWPAFNASQKQPQLRYGIYSYTDGRGYLRLAIDRKKKSLPALYQFNLLHEGQVLLRNMQASFQLHPKLCGIDKTALLDEDYQAAGAVDIYNASVAEAMASLLQQLPSFAVIDKGVQENEQLCFLVEKGCFWGMGILPEPVVSPTLESLKALLEPVADNDFIRNSLYHFAALHPDKRVDLSALQ
jgi:DNA polymerase-3 subunit epsilon